MDEHSASILCACGTRLDASRHSILEDLECPHCGTWTTITPKRLKESERLASRPSAATNDLGSLTEGPNSLDFEAFRCPHCSALPALRRPPSLAHHGGRNHMCSLP